MTTIEMSVPKIIAFYATPVDLPLQSETEAKALRDLGFDAVILTPEFRECLSTPSKIDVSSIVRQAHFALSEGLCPIFRLPTSPFPEWMLNQEFCYQRWDGSSNFGHMHAGSHRESVNVWHPFIKERIIELATSIYREVKAGWLSIGYGGCGELIGPTYTRPDCQSGALDLWLNDEISRELFHKWYNTDPPRTYAEGDWRGADFLSRRMAMWVEEIALSTPFQYIAAPLIIHPTPWSNLHVAAGFSTLPYWMDKVKVTLSQHGKRLNIFFFAVYTSQTPEHRLAYALTANTLQWNAWVGGEGLSFARNGILAATDGYKGLISRASTLLSQPKDFIKEQIAVTKALF